MTPFTNFHCLKLPYMSGSSLQTAQSTHRMGIDQTSATRKIYPKNWVRESPFSPVNHLPPPCEDQKPDINLQIKKKKNESERKEMQDRQQGWFFCSWVESQAWSLAEHPFNRLLFSTQLPQENVSFCLPSISHSVRVNLSINSSGDEHHISISPELLESNLSPGWREGPEFYLEPSQQGRASCQGQGSQSSHISALQRAWIAVKSMRVVSSDFAN